MDVEVAAGAGVGREVVVVSRDVWPPLRRWAAARLVRRDPDRWRGLLDAAEVLSSRDAAALTAGIMDAAEHIPNDDRAVAVAVGHDSGSGIVRLAALPAFAVLEGPDAALRRAATDPSAKVRVWTPTASRHRGTEPRAIHADDTDRPGTDTASGQPSSV
jgi:hypothetical protein